jgi:AcrR family transcriptional regulator
LRGGNDEGVGGRRAQTRARIIKATKKVITIHGMEKTTIRKIADEAGVSPGLVIQYFYSKAGLIQEIFLESNKVLLALFKERMDTAESFLELVLGALEAISVRDMRNPALTRQVMAFTWSWGQAEEVRFSKTLQDMSDVVANSMSVQFLPDDIELRRVASFALVNIYVGYLRIALQEDWSAKKLQKAVKPSVQIVVAGLEAMTHHDDEQNK